MAAPTFAVRSAIEDVGEGLVLLTKMGQKRERNLAVFAVDFADLKRYNAPMKCGTTHGTEERSRQP